MVEILTLWAGAKGFQSFWLNLPPTWRPKWPPNTPKTYPHGVQIKFDKLLATLIGFQTGQDQLWNDILDELCSNLGPKKLPN